MGDLCNMKILHTVIQILHYLPRLIGSFPQEGSSVNGSHISRQQDWAIEENSGYLSLKLKLGKTPESFHKKELGSMSIINEDYPVKIESILYSPVLSSVPSTMHGM